MSTDNVNRTSDGVMDGRHCNRSPAYLTEEVEARLLRRLLAQQVCRHNAFVMDQAELSQRLHMPYTVNTQKKIYNLIQQRPRYPGMCMRRGMHEKKITKSRKYWIVWQNEKIYSKNALHGIIFLIRWDIWHPAIYTFTAWNLSIALCVLSTASNERKIDDMISHTVMHNGQTLTNIPLHLRLNWRACVDIVTCNAIR